MGNLLIICHDEAFQTAEQGVILPEKTQQIARRVGTWLADHFIEPDLIVTPSASPASLETAARIMGVYPGSARPAFAKVPELAQRKYTRYVDSKSAIRSLQTPEAFDRLEHEVDFALPGGETLGALRERIDRMHTDIVEPKLIEGGNVVVITTEDPARTYINAIGNHPPQDIAKVSINAPAAVRFQVNNGHTRPIPEYL